MQNFLIISCFLAIAIAAPQYDYTPQYSVGSSSNFQQQYATGGGSSGGSSFGGGSFGGSSFIGGGGGGAIGDGAAFHSFNPAPALPSASAAAAIHRARPQSHRRVLPPIVSKHVYLHSAADEPDEEVFEDGSSQQDHKHYNVVFIKAPHQSVKSIASQTAQAINEQKTAIYVLSKKTDSAEIHQAIANSPHHASKPEVFFVKYRTPEEAQHAQQTIQSQYDALGGSTQVSNEGFAPISSVVGILDGGHGGFDNGGHGGHGGFNHGGHTGFHGGHIGTGGNGIISSGGGGNFIGSGSNVIGATSGSYLPPNKA